MVSSFWHGFYGGYYLSFFFWFVQSHLSQLIFSETKKPNSKYVKIYKSLGILGRILLWIASNFLMTVNGIYFQVLSLGQSIQILASLYFIPPLMVIIPTILLTVFKTREKSKYQKVAQPK